jgi:uncharacterized protein YceH (UPF0502 family)
MQLSAEEIRVLGCLAEKERTTPDDYPLTRNALVRACNQATSRFPVVAYPESTVDEALNQLKERGMVRFVHQAHGRAVTRYRQVFDERLGLDGAQMALVAALALRGPQTLMELRSRTERSHGFGSVEEVRTCLLSLTQPFDDAEGGLAVLLELQPHQKEARWTHLLSGEPETEVEGSSARPAGIAQTMVDTTHDLAELRSRVDTLESEVTMLRSKLEELIGPL